MAVMPAPEAPDREFRSTCRSARKNAGSASAEKRRGDAERRAVPEMPDQPPERGRPRADAGVERGENRAERRAAPVFADAVRHVRRKHRVRGAEPRAEHDGRENQPGARRRDREQDESGRDQHEAGREHPAVPKRSPSRPKSGRVTRMTTASVVRYTLLG